MAHVTLSRPSFGTLLATAPTRLVTEARVQHKAVKKMTKRRPKKVSCAQLCRLSVRMFLLWYLPLSRWCKLIVH